MMAIPISKVSSRGKGPIESKSLSLKPNEPAIHAPWQHVAKVLLTVKGSLDHKELRLAHQMGLVIETGTGS